MESLSETDRATLYRLRREIWKGSCEGGATGALISMFGYQVVVRTPLHTKLNFKLEPKHKFATPLFGLALGMLVGSVTSARNNAHHMQYILHKRRTNQRTVPTGHKPALNNSKQLTPYQQKVHGFDENSMVDVHEEALGHTQGVINSKINNILPGQSGLSSSVRGDRHFIAADDGGTILPFRSDDVWDEDKHAR